MSKAKNMSFLSRIIYPNGCTYPILTELVTEFANFVTQPIFKMYQRAQLISLNKLRFHETALDTPGRSNTKKKLIINFMIYFEVRLSVNH